MKKFYSTKEVAERVGISKVTLYDWLKKNKVRLEIMRDYRGYRVFTEEHIQKLLEFKNTLVPEKM